MRHSFLFASFFIILLLNSCFLSEEQKKANTDKKLAPQIVRSCETELVGKLYQPSSYKRGKIRKFFRDNENTQISAEWDFTEKNKYGTLIDNVAECRLGNTIALNLLEKRAVELRKETGNRWMLPPDLSEYREELQREGKKAEGDGFSYIGGSTRLKSND